VRKCQILPLIGHRIAASHMSGWSPGAKSNAVYEGVSRVAPLVPPKCWNAKKLFGNGSSVVLPVHYSPCALGVYFSRKSRERS
jgi:hypothetical protein